MAFLINTVLCKSLGTRLVLVKIVSSDIYSINSASLNQYKQKQKTKQVWESSVQKSFVRLKMYMYSLCSVLTSYFLLKMHTLYLRVLVKNDTTYHFSVPYTVINWTRSMFSVTPQCFFLNWSSQVDRFNNADLIIYILWQNLC